MLWLVFFTFLFKDVIEVIKQRVVLHANTYHKNYLKNKDLYNKKYKKNKFVHVSTRNNIILKSLYTRLLMDNVQVRINNKKVCTKNGLYKIKGKDL